MPSAPSSAPAGTPRVVLHDATTPDDLALFQRIVNDIDPDEARTPEQLLAITERFPDFIRTIAYIDHVPVGVASSVFMPRSHDGSYSLGLRVARGQADPAIHTVLYDHVANWTRARGGSTFIAWAEEDDTMKLTFLAERGFAGTTREMYVEIDPTAVDLPTPPPIDGLEIVTLAERPELVSSVYDIALRTVGDIPNEAPSDPPTYDQWLTGRTSDPCHVDTSLFIALVRGEPVGYAEIVQPPATPHLIWHALTGVVREHRGRGIARALKIRQLHWARDHGHRRLRTGNDVDNAPMRHINERLGYRPAGVEITLRGPVGAG